MKNEELAEPAFEIYMQYDFLTTQQYSLMLNSVNQIYTYVIGAVLTDEEFNTRDYNFSLNAFYPLCIDEAITGQSIKTRFSAKRKVFPSYKFEKGDLVIIIPKWYAAIIITSLILMYGLELYAKFLDIHIKQLDLDEKTKSNLFRQSEQISNLNDETAKQNIDKWHSMFKTSIVQSENIKEVKIILDGNSIRVDNTQGDDMRKENKEDITRRDREMEV